MWVDIKTPEGKLLFRINYELRLVESAKGGWIVTVNMDTQEVVKTRRVQQSKLTKNRRVPR